MADVSEVIRAHSTVHFVHGISLDFIFPKQERYDLIAHPLCSKLLIGKFARCREVVHLNLIVSNKSLLVKVLNTSKISGPDFGA